MRAASQTDFEGALSPRQVWTVVIVVALLHMIFAFIVQYGLPSFDRKKISEITIDLAPSLPRGQGGEDRATVVKPAAPPAPPVKTVTQDENATRRAPDKPVTAAPSVSQSSVAAGVDSAPTVDADYKAAYLNNPKPPYPAAAFKMRIEGTVVLKALVKPDGTCGEVLLGKSSGNDLLDRSALETVALWKFTPAKSQGKEVSQWVSIPITFSVKRR